ncbi:MAG: glycosyltransferase family 39 protein [Anaerolineae bacterium]
MRGAVPVQAGKQPSEGATSPTATKRTREGLLARVALLAILAGALVLRLYKVSWDGGYLFHPDERQILMVVNGLAFPWPLDLSLLLTPESPWNPAFFAYGSLPIYLLRILSWIAGIFDGRLATLESSYLVGRVLSALFDTGSVYLVYVLGRKLYNRAVGLLGAVFVALTVLHIQLAHFFAVDTLLTFFVLLTLSVAVDVARQPSRKGAVWLGLAVGLALATKVSASPILAVVGLAWLLPLSQRGAQMDGRPFGWAQAVLGAAASAAVALLTFVVCEPYAVIDLSTFLTSVLRESSMVQGTADFPYTRQYIGTPAYLYPLWQLVLWGMGVPLGIAGVLATAATVISPFALARRGFWKPGQVLPVVWVLLYFGITGGFHTKFMRYMLPIVPLLCLWAAWALTSLARADRRLLRGVGAGGTVVVLLGSAAYALAFTNVYQQEHPWIQTTRWICENVPVGSKISGEHWDDALPMVQGSGDLSCHRRYSTQKLPMYNADDLAKLETLLSAIQESDYLVLSSNRLYNTIPRLPERYPVTSRYYALLMSEQLGYELVYYAAVYPRIAGVDLANDTFHDPDLPQPRLLREGEAGQARLNLGRADESFTVYDRPMALVFKKTRQLSREELLDLLGPAAQKLVAAPAGN